MDLIELNFKKEEHFEMEDDNENYLKLDFEVDVKVENDSPVYQDWCLENVEYQDTIACELVKEECDIQTCFICLRMFADSYSLYKHNIAHLAVVLKPKRLFQCEHCTHYFANKKKIRKHMKTKHFMLYLKRDGTITDRFHQCTICDKVYTYKRWHAHMIEVHGTEKIRCRHCDITFKCIRYLRRHLLYKHENVRPSWRFHKVQGLDPGEEFKCELCPAVFKNRNSRKTHVRNCHSSDKHECVICHSKLKSRSYLLTHMKRVHYNDGKLHKCNICFKVFKSPRYLNIHKKNTHTVKIQTKKRKAYTK